MSSSTSGTRKSEAPAEAPAAEAAYVESCKDLLTAIGSLESSLISFTGKESLQGEVFSHTRARLAEELSVEARAARDQ